MRKPRQDDIPSLNTVPQPGHEQAGKRSYIVLSHDITVDYNNAVTATPASSITRNYPLYVNINSEYEMKATGKVLLDQLTMIGYEARECISLEKTHDSLVEELLMKVRTVFQEVSK